MNTTIITTSQAAARLGIDPSRVRRLAQRYGIGQKIGPRTWVFSEDDIAALQSHSTGKSGRPSRRVIDVVANPSISTGKQKPCP